MVNYCRNYRKKRGRYNVVSLNRVSASKGYEVQIKDERQDPEKEILDTDALRILKEELFQLPEDYKEILVLRDIEGLPYGEISKVLGINLSNVKVRIHRGREMLKKRLAERGLL
jgi:RNA polymerase sigma-70 factor (ECF subfamily)